MDFFTKFSSSKDDSISPSLSSIMLWTAKLPSPLHLPKQSSGTPIQHNLQVGLKTQIHSEEAKRPPISAPSPKIVHCYTLPRVSKRPAAPSSSSLLSSSSSAFRYSVTDDVIGTESGDYMSSSLCNVEGLKKMSEKSEPPTTHNRLRYRNAMTKQYLPPIPLVAQTGNVPGRMPLVFKRQITQDGRLIITAERFKRREYLVAYRENGRLVMKLIPVNDAVYCEYCGQPLDEEEDVEFYQEKVEEVADTSYDDGVGVEVEEEVASEGSRERERDRCGDLRKCFNYAGGLVRDSDNFWKVHGLGGANGYLGQPGSAALRPMTPVM